MTGFWRAALRAVAAFLLVLLAGVDAFTQEAEAVVAPAAGSPQPAATSTPQPTDSDAASPMPAKPHGAASPAAAKGDSPSPEGKEPEKKKEEGAAPGPVTRPKEAPGPADPAELRAAPSDDGMIRFSFRNQPWPAVLQWLADVSALSLDWQELPGDYLNLSLQRSYTLPEARDLINRHLLARGYTMLLDGETLTVVKLEKLNAGLVPRVAPEDLENRQPHDFVKVSFPLTWMVAERAVEELKPMLSPHGKLFAFKETNRLEALDTAANLREVYRLLSQEQSPAGEERLVREFPLQHTRAADVRLLLLELLGMDSKSEQAGPMTPQQMQMMQQQQQMMQQQMAQRGGNPNAAAGGDSKKNEVSLVVNPRNNSILATAPPDKMAILEQAVPMLDTPTAPHQSLLANMTKMQIYRLAAVAPEPIVKTLQEVGDLSPQTRLEVDAKNRAIIAYATLADHVAIRAMVEKLDGSARSFEVIPLRRLSADYVAGTVRFLLGNEEENKQQRRYPSYFYGGYGGSEPDQPKDAFRVDADVENNRLLVWANPTELAEVLGLLEKLGEIPQRGGDPRRVRTVEVLPSQQAPGFFDQLEEAFRSMAPNELQIDPSLEKDAPPKAGNEDAAPQVEKAASHHDRSEATDAAFARTEASGRREPADENRGIGDTYGSRTEASHQGAYAPRSPVPRSPIARFVQSTAPDTEAAAPISPETATAPPVRITRGRDGRLVVASQDPAALDLLEDLLREMASKRKAFEVFQLRYAPAFWVALNLEDFFKDDKKDDSRNNGYGWWYYDMPRETDREDPRRLSDRPPLKFISDDDTNTIVVQGADPQQLETVAQLIELYDQPPPEDAQSRRVTQIFAIRFSKAEVISEALKDVYRDLLSANDKALAQQQQQPNQRPAGETYITNIGFGDEAEERDRRTQVTFKGKLSIGVDELTNTLLVSTEGEALMRNVQEMIERLDQAAQPRTTVEVLRLGNSGGATLQKALAEIFREQTLSSGGQAQHRGGQQGPGQPQQPAQANPAATGG